MFEIRNCYYKPELVEAYKQWARARTLLCLKRELDLICFWTNLPEAAQITGKAMDDLGPVNSTGNLQWPDMATHDDTMTKVFATPEWNETFKPVPGGISSYLRMESELQ